MVTIDEDRDPTPAELAFWKAGGHPPWKRVWHEGVDVTDHDPATWNQFVPIFGPVPVLG
jgi:hypothetical protein